MKRGLFFARTVSREYSAAPRSNPRVESLAKLVMQDLNKNASLGDVIRAVWSNATVTSQCPDLVIRLTTLRGQVSSSLWKSLGHNPDQIQLLAVGSTDHPLHMPQYSSFLQNFYKRTADNIVRHAKSDALDIGYDLLSTGNLDTRRQVLSLFNEHFGAPEKVLSQLADNSAFVCGGMRGLKDLADGQVIAAQKQGTFLRFVQPDNSFGTWWNIVEAPDDRGRDRRQIVKLGTSPSNKLHLSVPDVENFYRSSKPHSHELWYITPVGNPSGTCMGDQLTEVCESITKHNPKAIIIMDSVYVRTMRRERAQKLFRNLWNSPSLQNVVFLESLSKSHGLCRERLGVYFSANPKLFTEAHTANIAFSAGPGLVKDHQFQAIADSTAADKAGIDGLHAFWRDERKGLVEYLLRPEFSDLFESDQPHLWDDLNQECTLYVLLKVRPNVTSSQVFERTGALGVDTKLVSGNYIRYAVGMLRGPAYSKK